MKFFFFVICLFTGLMSHSEVKKIPSDSIFQIQTTWINQDGKDVKLESFAGKPTVLAMVYLSCKFLCPTIISEVQNLESKIDAKKRERVQVILASFDPEKDTPVVMKAYAKKRKLDSPHWTLVTSKTDAAPRELSAVLDFKYKKIEGGDFTHSFMIVVLNDLGVPVARIDSVNQDKKLLVDAIESLLVPKN